MIKYNTREDCNKFVTNPGDRYMLEYDTIVEPNGKVIITPAGKKDLYQEIQSWKEQTDMHYILNQMALGQYPMRENVMYGDFTEAPENMQEAMQMMINAEKAFYELPLDTRRKFDNDFKQWMMSAQTDYEEFYKKMGFASDQTVFTSEEVKGDDKE